MKNIKIVGVQWGSKLDIYSIVYIAFFNKKSYSNLSKHFNSIEDKIEEISFPKFESQRETIILDNN